MAIVEADNARTANIDVFMVEELMETLESGN